MFFLNKSFTEVLNFSKLSFSNNFKGKSFQSFGARQANFFSPNLLLAEESWRLFFAAPQFYENVVSSHINFRACFFRSPMIWNEEKDVLLRRELLLVEPYNAKEEIKERGKTWSCICDHIKPIPGFTVSARAVRERFKLL